MSREEPFQSSSLDLYPLSSPLSSQALSVFSQLLLSCSGPHGKNHIIRNTCGGHMTITSTCSRLLSSMMISRSELKLAASAIKGHLQQQGDCGLFMAHISLHLTKSMLNSGIHHSVATMAFQSFVSIIVDNIKNDNCNVCVKADFSNISVLLAYVQSVLTSKALLNLQLRDLNNLSLVLLNTFIKSIPCVSQLQRFSSGIFVLGMEKQSVKNCKSVDGIMLEFPELATVGDLSVLMSRWEMKADEHLTPEPYLKVALITCSMSGDIEETASVIIEGTEQQFMDMEKCVLDKLTTLCHNLERQNVEVVLCQKVIHPKIKVILKLKNILFMDRLGSQPIPFIRDLTGCQPITSILSQNIHGDDGCFGRLASVVPCIENGKRYICLKNNSSCVITLMVYAEWEERLSELKECVNSCLQGLGVLVKERRLLMGGGCWQMQCSHVLKEEVLHSLPELSKKLSCTDSTLRQLLTVFRSCLHQWCLSLKEDTEHLSFDPSSKHSWRVTKNVSASLSDLTMESCCCGLKAMSSNHLPDLDIVMSENNSVIATDRKNILAGVVTDIKTYDCVVLDSLTACMEAFHKGVMTAGLLMSIGQFICDRN